MPTEFETGLAALQRGDLAAAIPSLERAVQLVPDDFNAHLHLGGAYSQANRHDDAIRVITQAVHIQPSNAQARYNLAIALERAGWHEQAMAGFQQAVQLQPDYPQAQQAIQRLQSAQQPAPVAPLMNYQSAMPTQFSQGTAPVPQYASQPPPQNPLPYGQPGTSPQPSGYWIPPQTYAPVPQHNYNPPAYSAPASNIGLGALAGVVVALLCGLVFGFGSVAVGFRIPYLTFLIGYVVGYAVLKASGGPGGTQGIIAGACAGGGTLLGIYILFIGTGIISYFGSAFALYAIFRAFTIASNG